MLRTMSIGGGPWFVPGEHWEHGKGVRNHTTKKFWKPRPPLCRQRIWIFRKGLPPEAIPVEYNRMHPLLEWWQL